MFTRIISTSATWVTVPLRLALAVIFFAHGAQKALGSFGGKGLRAWISGSAPFSFMRPTWLWLGVAAFSELIGSILIFLGLLTRVGALLIACTMLTAIAGVHWPHFFSRDNGFELPLALLGMCVALLIVGGGSASVDYGLAGRRR
jgi:putative oxidoreductase